VIEPAVLEVNGLSEQGVKVEVISLSMTRLLCMRLGARPIQRYPRKACIL
jgi:hypothetical protein